jgi:hypothetical protein
MSKQENQEQKNQTIEIEDLPVDEAQQDEVKGGATQVEYAVQLALINPSTTSTTVKSNGNLQIADLTSVALDPL